MLRLQAVFLAVVAGSYASALAGEPPPIRLSNSQLSLQFDGRTGAWIGFVDVRSGRQLVTGPATPTMIRPPAVRRLDSQVIHRAVAAGQALELDGQWLYTPVPPSPAAATRFVQGRFDGERWQTTPIPSRRGAGDDRLHDRVGEFFYRREFTCPPQWSDEEMLLILGAVDDFDVTYINGTEIGSTGVDVPHHWQTARIYSFPGSLLHHGRPNTLLVKVNNAAYDGGIDGPLAVGPLSALVAVESSESRLLNVSLTHKSSAALLKMTARDDDYEYRLDYCLPDGQPWFTRQLTVHNVSGVEKLLHPVACTTPSLRVGPRQTVVFPGSLPLGDTPIATLPRTQWLRPQSNEPLAVLWDASERRGLGVWFHCEEEFSPVAVRRSGIGAEFQHLQHIVVRLKPGLSVALGKQFFWLAHDSRDAALRGIEQVYRAVGLQAPDHALAGLREAVLYCGHPGGTPEQHFRDYGGFTALRRYVPTLRKMGVNLLWLLPIWEHGDDTRWNLYGPFDHFRISPLYGTPEELRQLSTAARQSGIGLIFDLVPHGPPDFTPLARAHPEWIALDAKGKRQYAWGQYAFDYAHPGWQDYMRRAAAWDARQYGAVGARVDCGAGGPLNWNPALGDRPSRSSLAGGLAMNRAIREGFLDVDRQALLLPEEYTGANIFYRVADLTYDAQFYFLMVDLQARGASPQEWSAALQQFLHDQQLTLPPGALKMRWISNHDTVSWTFQKKRPIKLYGVERMRALLAICALVEGVPMLYQGDEDPTIYGSQGASSVDFLGRVYSLRKQLPSLRSGRADYEAARATGGVFACLRCAPSEDALVLVSLNPQSVTSLVTLPNPGVTRWTDVLSGESLPDERPSKVAMAPFQVRVFVRPLSPGSPPSVDRPERR
jgi:hypothetical protein